MSETVQTAHKMTGQYAVSPVDRQVETRVVLRNVQTRLWLWGQVLHYLQTHPLAILIGVGYDRQVFVERVLGLPYTNATFQFQTAHSLLLDILVKGGLVPFIALILLYAWLLWEAVLGMMIPRVAKQDPARIGLHGRCSVFGLLFLEPIFPAKRCSRIISSFIGRCSPVCCLGCARWRFGNGFLAKLRMSRPRQA